MKKIIFCLLLCTCMYFVLVGCNTLQGTQTSEEGNTSKIYNNDIYEFIDPDTGVHYWIYSHYDEGGMTPRLNSDGSVMTTSIKEVLL